MLFALTSQDRLIRELYRFICMFLTDTSQGVVLIPAGLALTRISFLPIYHLALTGAKYFNVGNNLLEKGNEQFLLA
jgi:hypothetical protein